MSVTSISKGIVLYLLTVILCVGALNMNEFVITERQFTSFLVISIFLIGMYTGFNAKTYSVLNGFFIGIISSITILLMISPYVGMHWDLNFMILVVWVSISISGSFLGNYSYRLIEKKKASILNKTESISKIKTKA